MTTKGNESTETSTHTSSEEDAQATRRRERYEQAKNEPKVPFPRSPLPADLRDAIPISEEDALKLSPEQIQEKYGTPSEDDAE